MNYGKLFHLASLFLFGAAFLDATVFGHTGGELIAGGLFLYAGGDLAEDVLS